MAKKKDDIKFSELTTDELQVKLRENQEKLFQLKFQNTTAPLKNPREIRTTRRTLPGRSRSYGKRESPRDCDKDRTR
jgi:ribosomal protein L29